MIIGILSSWQSSLTASIDIAIDSATNQVNHRVATCVHAGQSATAIDATRDGGSTLDGKV